MKNKKTVFFLGSINMDIILQVARLPKPGETMAMKDLKTAGGGKGANQAVAAARSEAATSFIGRVGADNYGETMLKLLQDNGVDCSNVKVDQAAITGQAFILLQDSGQNSIIINGGANQCLQPQDIVAASEQFQHATFAVSQFEVPLQRIEEFFRIAKKAGVATILNPAPAKKASAKLLQLTDLIVPNEVEAQELTGVVIKDEQTARQAALELVNKGIKNVIITLGSLGAYCQTPAFTGLIPAFKVEVVDTTGAGDTFIGALSSVLEHDFSNIEEAVRYASKAASLAVQHLGAIPSIPTRKQVLAK
ncbi:ribokinase [Liquorilactobacillus satsumensis]|uniref:Ribokinase n=1 Tax=Liquorilactobacillus satsumensis DSM 16230 = JCM 12392 TaxID=1423801 RepID=A0A0R1V9A4_9LACO|nr:ribokinase [Liquorilactobacillus satsumensis]KRM00555.1 ribokinase [Liquorilactobacillus satsumensis DSM 16230 = JCM 12392]MCC7667392.1 ribokinase [Liquorilactobacillus satsumensis]MCP9313251.1 ribokinase [Liquorilactobacillus satsumensis]MCP9329503.1 ribokinase [Liquorilactobacillus satsumensis]MCP9358608.1 ribokinase [Liquorilactobacillus satsumensis]